MKHFIALTGMILTLLPGVTAAEETTLYKRLKQQVEREEAVETVDDEVATFVQMSVQDEWDLTTDEVKDVIRGYAWKVCGDAQGSPMSQITECTRMADTVKRIAVDQQKIRIIGRTLQPLATGYELPLSDLPDRVLKFSADLQAILGIWSAGTGSVRLDRDAVVTRTVRADEATFRPLLEDLGRVLEDLSPEERTAAVWRYNQGVRLVRGERAPRFPRPAVPAGADDTERQYLTRQWTDVEDALNALWNEGRNVRLNPPLTSTETAYLVFPTDLIAETLPDNVITWIRLDGDAAGGYPFGEAGLEWVIAVEPVMPSLKKRTADEPIPGGEYPPEPYAPTDDSPPEGQLLCTSPAALRGYLCRPIENTDEGLHCPISPEPADDEIQIVACTRTDDGFSGIWCCNRNSRQCSMSDTGTECVQNGGSPSASPEGCAANGCIVPQVNPVYCCLPANQGRQCVEMVNSSSCVQQGGSPSADVQGCMQNGCAMPEPDNTRYTAQGPDVCREITWKNPAPFNPNTQCKIIVGCASQGCPVGAGNSATTYPKNDQGEIRVCSLDNPPDIQVTYLIYHELVHANQLCAAPVNHEWYEDVPGGASAQEERDIRARNTELCCRLEGEAYATQCAMMERDGVFEDISEVDGIPMNAQTCAEWWTDFSCGPRDGFNGCYTSYAYTVPFRDTLVQASTRNPKNLPSQCADAIDPETADPRVTALRELGERYSQACTPGTVTEYPNRIGNNMCYVGQCVEQSVELHRLTAGRSPGTTSDMVAPWNDPETSTPLGNALTSPVIGQFDYPAYRPEALVRMLDAALCESVGLPALMPTTLCLTEASRQLELSRTVGLETALGLLGQNLEQLAELRDLSELARGIGIRTGTDLYGSYLKETTRSFSDIISMAAALLKQLENVSFPAEMCPVSPGLPSTASDDQ